MKTIFKIFIIAFTLIITACGNNSSSSTSDKAPVKLPSQGGRRSSRSDIKVKFEQNGNVKVVPVKLNGVSMDMIFDTGCSGMHLSLAELAQLVKQGKFSELDFIGNDVSMIADGSIVENGVIILRTVKIGGDEGFEIHDVEARVSLNTEAPLLLGNNVLDEFASYTIDNENQTISFKKR